MQKLSKPTAESEVIQTLNLYTIQNSWIASPNKFKILDQRLIENGQLELKKIFETIVLHTLDQLSTFKLAQDKRMSPDLIKISFLNRFSDKKSSAFGELYALLEQSKCICETQLKDYFLRERFLLVTEHMSQNLISEMGKRILSFNMLAYNRKIVHQDELQNDMLDVY